MVNSVAENIFGTIGSICWSVQLIPQIYKSYRTKSTKGLSEWLLFLWAISGSFLGVYVVAQNLNIPLIAQPQLLATFSTISWIQCQYYGNRRSLTTCIALFSAMIAILAGFELGMVYVTRSALGAGNSRPIQFFGIFAAILLASGLFPQYYEIYKYKEVIGISLAFMIIDCFGGVSSIISLAFKDTIDVIAAVAYAGVVLLDGIVILAYFVLNPIARKKRQGERATNPSVELTTQTTDIVSIPAREQIFDHRCIMKRMGGRL